MLSDTKVMCDAVSKKLKDEGKAEASQDEKLFIDMVLQLNEQASEMQKEEKSTISTPEKSAAAAEDEVGAKRRAVAESGMAGAGTRKKVRA
jgi:hypothetical protein